MDDPCDGHILANARREALSCLDALEHAQTSEQIIDVMAAALGAFGAEFFCFNFFPDAEQKFEEVMLAHRIPAEWVRLYLDKNFAKVDPSIRLCRNTVRPFEYLDAPFDADREPDAAEVIRQATEFGLSRGLLVPVAGPAGCIGDVWIGGYRLQLAADAKPIAHLLSLYAFERIRQLAACARRKRVRVTAREREVLTWIAAGKSAWEIGIILNIAKRTVDEHTQTAARKLGASNRTHAVALAILGGVIQP